MLLFLGSTRAALHRPRFEMSCLSSSQLSPDWLLNVNVRVEKNMSLTSALKKTVKSCESPKTNGSQWLWPSFVYSLWSAHQRHGGQRSGGHREQRSISPSTSASRHRHTAESRRSRHIATQRGLMREATHTHTHTMRPAFCITNTRENEYTDCKQSVLGKEGMVQVRSPVQNRAPCWSLC